MKVIIAGSRNADPGWVAPMMAEFSRSRFPIITEVVHGYSGNIDLAGEQWALERAIPVRRFPADWKTHGKAAGPLRNRQMAEYAQGLVAIWDGESRGTRNMIEEAKARGLLLLVHITR